MKISTKFKGFTLIELLVVIAIIGLLATFIVASFTSAQQKARDSRRKADLDALKKALTLAKSDTTGASYFPNSIAGTVLTNPGYIKTLPSDPTSAAAYVYSAAPAGCTTQCTAFRLRATLENTNDQQRAGSGTPQSSGAACPGNTDGFSISYNPQDYVVCQP